MNIPKALPLAVLLALSATAGIALANDNVPNAAQQYGTGASGSGSNGTVGPQTYEGRSAAPGYIEERGPVVIDGPVQVAPAAPLEDSDDDDDE
jgi:hypothetical protein